MAEGAQIIEGLFKPRPRPVEAHPQSNVGTHDFTRRPSFKSYGGDVFWGTARLSPETVEALLRDFQRDACATGDWTIFDQLCAARDGLDPEPPAAA